MDWLKSGLLSSEATLKVIVHSAPISNLTSLSFSLQQLLSYTSWAAYPNNRSNILSYIDDNSISGVVWVTGGLECSIVVGNLSQLNDTHYIPNSKQFEVITGPVGSQINSIVKFSSLQTSGPYKLLGSSWTYTLFELDPLIGQLNITLVDDTGYKFNQLVITVNDLKLGLPDQQFEQNFGF